MSEWIFEHHYVAYWTDLRFESISVRYPDGNKRDFGIDSGYRARGSNDRLVVNSRGEPETLLMGDGGRVEFSVGRDSGPGFERANWVGTRIVDPFGVALTIEPQNRFGPRRVTDASGRWIEFSWDGNGVTEVNSSAGQRVRYRLQPQHYWSWPLIRAAEYQDGTFASYQFNNDTPRNLPALLEDNRAVARMQRIRYVWRLKESADVFFELDSEQHPNGTTVTHRERGYVEVLPNGEARAFVYTESGADAGLLYEEFDFSGNRWRYGYDSNYMLVSVRDPRGHTTTIDVEDVAGRPTAITFADGSVRRFTYTDSQNPYHLETITDELGRVIRYERFPNNAVRRIIYPDGTEESWADLTPFGQPREHTLPTGAKEYFEYDSMGRLIRHWLPTFLDRQASITYTYYPDGHVWEDRVETETDPLGRVTRFEYDVVGGDDPVTPPIPRSGRGLITRTIFPDDSSTSSRYTNYGRLRRSTDENGHTTTYTYDDYQRLLTETDPLGHVTQYDYAHAAFPSSLASTADLPATITSPSGRRIRMTYDGDFRLLSRTEGFGTADAATHQIEYDSAGNVIRETDPLGRATTFGYDNRGRRTQKTAPGNRRTSWAYDRVGNNTWVTHPDGSHTYYSYDSMNRVRSSWDELVRQTNYLYDEMGRLLRVTDPEGRVSGFDYDARGNVRRRRAPDPSGAASAWLEYIYDFAGNVVARSDARGVSVTYTYDARNREVERKYSDGTRTVGLEYDPAGRLIRAHDSIIELSFAYDEAGRLIHENQSGNAGCAATLSHEYDKDGNRNRLRVGGDIGYHVTYSHNARNQLTGVFLPDQSGVLPLPIVGYDYAADGQRTTKYISDGASARFVETITYDEAGRPEVVSGPQSYELVYSYDERDRRTQLSANNGNLRQTFTYYLDSQLAEQEVIRFRSPGHLPERFVHNTFAYDGSGNRVSSSRHGSYAVNAANQYTSYDGGVLPRRWFEYDAIGNLTRRGGAPPGVSLSSDWEYYYDGESRLRSAVTKSFHNYSFTYDPIGRLVTTRHFYGDGTTWSCLLYDGQRPIVRFGGSINAPAEHERTYWDPTTDEPLYAERIHSEPIYYLLDAQKSVTAVANRSGTILEMYAYDAFGEAHAFWYYHGLWMPREESTIRPQYLFTSQWFLEDLNLYHYRARTYDPGLGRFLQRDPLGIDAGDLNLYRYVRNNPANYIDPEGTFLETPLDLGFVVMDIVFLAEDIAAGEWGDAALTAVGLAADAAATVIPGVPGGLGMLLRGGDKALDVADGVSKTRRNLDRLDSAGDAGEVGSYTNLHESGMTYTGKGGRARSQRSGREKAAQYNDPHVATDFTKSKNSREAFKDEDRRLEALGGVESDSNYNKINSPGRRMRREDGETHRYHKNTSLGKPPWLPERVGLPVGLPVGRPPWR